MNGFKYHPGAKYSFPYSSVLGEIPRTGKLEILSQLDRDEHDCYYSVRIDVGTDPENRRVSQKLLDKLYINQTHLC